MKFWLGKKNMLSEPASLRTETPGEEKAGKPCCYALPVGTRPRLKQISHKNVKHWVMAEYHMYRTFTTRSLLLSVPPRATTLQSPLQPAPLETEKKKKITETHQTSRSASLTACLCKVPLSVQISTTLHISDWKQSPSPNVTVRTTPTTFSALSNPLDRSITKDIFYSSAQHSPPSTLTGSTQAAADFSECIQLCLTSLFL